MVQDEAREPEELEAKAKRIERWRQTGRIFDLTPDLRWLFVELALTNGGELDWLDKDRLTDLVAEPIWGSLWSERSYCDLLMEQGAIFVENTKFHSTALRDFFILRLVSCLAKAIRDYEPKRKKLVWHLVACAVVFGLLTYSVWLGSALVVLYLLIEGGKTRAHLKWQKQKLKVESAENVIRRGGFDEPEMIGALEALQHGGAPVPSVLYALLRLPRRNVEHEVSRAYNALNEEKKKAVWEQWRAFLDFMLKNDDGEAARKLREIEDSECAAVFTPIRRALNEVSLQFADDNTVRFLSKDKANYRAGYEIDIKHDGLRHYLYVRCEKVGEGQYRYPMRVCVPESESKWLWFSVGEESKPIGIISALLGRYRDKRALSTGDVESILAGVEA